MQKANQKLEALLALWHEKRGGKLMPSRTDLPASTLRPWLGNLALIDFSANSPFFRLCGTGLYARFGGEMTRRKVDALEDEHGKKKLIQTIEEVRLTSTPKRTSHIAVSPEGKATFHELCAPLAHDGVNIDMVLFASYVEQKLQ